MHMGSTHSLKLKDSEIDNFFKMQLYEVKWHWRKDWKQKDEQDITGKY